MDDTEKENLSGRKNGCESYYNSKKDFYQVETTANKQEAYLNKYQENMYSNEDIHENISKVDQQGSSSKIVGFKMVFPKDSRIVFPDSSEIVFPKSNRKRKTRKLKEGYKKEN